MPNPYAAIPITFQPDGAPAPTDLQAADFGIFLEIDEGLDELAEHDGIDFTVPGLPGRLEGSREARFRKILLTGWVKGLGATPGDDYRTKVIALQALFDPVTPGALVATLEDGQTATIRARGSENPLMWGAREGPFFRRLSVELESIAPNWTLS